MINNILLAQAWYIIKGVGIGFFLFIALLLITAYVSFRFRLRDPEAVKGMQEYWREED